MSEAEGLDRRMFARQFLGGLGAASVMAGSLEGDDKAPPSKEELKPDAEERTPPAELLILSALIQNYPSDRYTDEIFRSIYREIVGDVARGKQLRAFPLQNSDEPACVFRVVRAREGTP